MVSEGREGRNSGGLLATTVASSRDEHASELSVQLALLPEATGGIPKGLQKRAKPQPNENKMDKIYAYLPLTREVTVSGGDANKESIIVSKIVGIEDRIIGLGGRMHLGQNFLGKSLGDPRVKSSQTRNVQRREQHLLVDGNATTTGTLDALLLSLGH